MPNVELPRFGLHVLRLALLGSTYDRSVRSRFCALRPPTFAITSRVIPDAEGYLSRQAKVTHGRSEKHVATRSFPFCSERVSLLFHEGEHFAVGRTVGDCSRSKARLLLGSRSWPAPFAIVGSNRQVRPERTSIEVEGFVAEAHLSPVVTEASVASRCDRSCRLLAPFAANKPNTPSPPSVQQFVGRCRKGHGRLVHA
jgi:hypothetical protein